MARNDLAGSRRGAWPALSAHHAPRVGVALPVDQRYEYMTGEVVVLPAAAEADVSMYLRDGGDIDPLVGEAVAVNIDITPRGDTMRNPIVLFETADEDGAGGDALAADAFEGRAADRTSRARTCTYREGALCPTTSLGPAEGMSEAIEKGATKTLTFYLTWEAAATTEVTAILQYTTDVGGGAAGAPRSARHFECEQRVVLTAIDPFHAEIRFEDAHGRYTLQDTSLQRADGAPGSPAPGAAGSPEEPPVYLPDGADVLMVTTLTCFSTAPLEVLEIVPGAAETGSAAPGGAAAPGGSAAPGGCAAGAEGDGRDPGGRAESVVSRGEILSSVMPIAVPAYDDVNKSVPLGSICIRWRRRPAGATVSSEVRLPDVFVRPALCRVTCECDERAYVGTPFGMKVVLDNLSNLVQEYRVTVGDAGALLYAGDRSSRVTVLPRRRFTVKLVLLSTAAGTFRVPTIGVSTTRFTSHMETAPGTIHVLPAAAGGP